MYTTIIYLCLFPHSLFTNMTKSIVISHRKKTTDDEYRSSFPPFLWLLRDAFVRMPEENGIELTPTEYLIKEVLEDSNPDSMEVAVCRALKQFFPSFVYKTLPAPSADTEVMRAIATNQNNLTASFNHEVDELIAFVKVQVKPKQVFSNTGPSCDGHILASLVQEIAKAVNDPNSIPAIDNTWKLVVQSRCRDVQEKLIAEYRTTIKTRYDSASKGSPLEETVSIKEQCASVIGIHNELWTEIKEMLRKEIGPLLSIPVSEECTLQSVTDQLENQLVQFQLEIVPHTDKSVRKVIGGALYAIAEENRKRSREYCNKLFTDRYTRIRKQVEVAEDGDTVKTLEADIEKLRQEYDSKSVAPEKMYIHEKTERQIEENKRMFQGLLQRAQEHREVTIMYKKIDAKLEEQKKDYEKRVQAEEKKREEVEKKLEETQKFLDANKKQLIHETQRCTEERHKKEKAEAKLQQMNKTLEERQKVAQERLDDEKQRTRNAEARLEEVRHERDELKVQLTKEELTKKNAVENLEHDRKVYAHIIKVKETEITKQTTKVCETKKELEKEKEEHKKEAERLTKYIDEKTKEAEQLTKAVDEKTKEAEQLTKDVDEKTKEAEQLTKDIANKTKEIQTLENSVKDMAKAAEQVAQEIKHKTEEVDKLKQYIGEFEASYWFQKMLWRKRHDEQ